MRFLSTRVHGVLDYLMGLALVALPILLNFRMESPQAMVPMVLGIGVILYSLFTEYELGAVQVIPMGVHLTLDMLGGILLAASPWLFGFADRIWIPHVAFGVLEMGAALFTQTVPFGRTVRPGSGEPLAG